jgi:Flp pilus assembly protein TadG
MKKSSGENGQTLISAALSATVLLGFIAFATDVGVLFHQKRQLQTAADAAAIAAATEALAEGNPSTTSTVSAGVYQAAENDASDNGSTPGTSNGSLNTANGITLEVTTGSNNTVPAFQSAGYFQATINETNPTLFIGAFMGLIGNSSYSGMTVGATAIASDTITSNGCVYVTDPGLAAVPAVEEGGSSSLDAPACDVIVNGNIDFNSGAASITAQNVIASGTISTMQSGWTEDAPTPPDPLAYLSTPAYQPTLTTTGGTTTCAAPPGSGLTNCSYDATTINASNTMYYFDKSPSITGTVTGSGDVIYLAGTSTYLDLDTNSAVTLTPPTSGILANVVIDAPFITGTGNGCKSGKGNNRDNPGEIYVDFGSSSTTLNGIVYAPNAEIFGQDQGSSTSIKLDLVVGDICMQSATFQVGGYSANNPITRVGLVY